MALAGTASAQSSVTIFGIIDATVGNYSNKSQDRNPTVLPNAFGIPTHINQGSQTLSQTLLTNSGDATSRIGFRGTEDLGGGMAASFWLESPLSNDDGQTGISTFQRRSTVSLSGNFGEIRLGRDFVATFWNNTIYDPYGTTGAGTSLVFRAGAAANVFGPSIPAVPGVPSVLGSNGARASNMIAYFLPPNLGGFYGQAQYAFSEKTKYDPGTATPAGGDTRSGGYFGGRLGYGNGPFDIAIAYGDSTLASEYYAGSTTQLDTINLGASYNFGPVKLSAELSRVSTKVDYALTPLNPLRDVDINGYLIAAVVPVGDDLIKAAYSHVQYNHNQMANPFSGTGPSPEPRASQLALGYEHNLSKRTALYGTLVRISDKNGANLTVGGPAFAAGSMTPKSSTGYEFGIRHAF